MKNCMGLITLVVTLVFLCPVSAQAQEQPVAQQVAPGMTGSFSFHSDLVLQQAGPKSPAVAGLLSFLIPGVGSYYAGYATHGTTHLLVGLGSAGVSLIGFGMAVTTCLFSCSPEEEAAEAAWTGVFLVGFAAYTVNWVWSVVTAVGDANRYNRVVGGGVASWIQPDVRVLTSTPTAFSTLAPRTGPRLGLQVAKSSF